MKVLEKGKPPSRNLVCTGRGNGGGGCSAKLEVERSDLFQTSRHSYGDQYPDYFITFKCPDCGVLTDIDDFPGVIRATDLPKQRRDDGGL